MLLTASAGIKMEINNPLAFGEEEDLVGQLPFHPVCQPHSCDGQLWEGHEGLGLLHPPPASRLPGLERAGQGMMLPLGSPLGLSSCLPYKCSSKAVLGLLVLLLVVLGGGRWGPNSCCW